ncbi:MAG TPA: MarR family transcriptional regulator [Caulobacteraceae bacterium]
MALDPEWYGALAGFRSALRRFLAGSESLSREAGVTPPQYQAMLAIKTRPGATMAMKELAEQLLLTHHAAVQMVDRLAKAGLASREASTADRRLVLLKLTPKGEALLDELAARHLEVMLRQEPALSASLKDLRKLAKATPPHD